MQFRPRDDTALAEFAGGGAVFSYGQQRLYSLNETATIIWSALSNNATPESASQALAAKSGIELGLATDQVAACLRQWASLGLLGPSIDPIGRDMPLNSMPALRWPHDEVFLAGGTTFGISYPDDRIGAAVRSIMGHLRADNDEVPDVCFAIRSVSRFYRLFGPTSEGSLVDGAAAAAVELKSFLFEEVLRRRPSAMAIHAGAVVSPRGVAVLIGRSGSGKTTLGALLNAHGWPVISDDVTFVDGDTGSMGGLALAFAAKAGSWPVLTNARPEMMTLPTYVRPDGRSVKYLAPAAVASSPVNGPVVSFLFPHYRPGAVFELEDLGKIEALARILSEARNSAQRLSLNGFQTLARIVGGASVFEFAYDDAQTVAEALLRHPIHIAPPENGRPARSRPSSTTSFE